MKNQSQFYEFAVYDCHGLWGWWRAWANSPEEAKERIRFALEEEEIDHKTIRFESIPDTNRLLIN